MLGLTSHIRISRKRLRLYIWMCAAFLLITVLNSLSGPANQIFASLLNNLWHLLFLSVLHFILLEYVLKAFKLNWKRVLLAIPVIFVFMMTYSFGHYAWKQLGVAIQVYTPLTEYTYWDDETADLMAYSMGSLFFFGVVRHFFDYRDLRLSAQQLQIEKQLAELNYLKSQTNPHFLFNTLNNIYSLARDKSDLAPESLLRLSKILRFMLYETSGEFISVEEELQIIDDYIALEQLRYDNSLRINYNHNIEDKKQAIPPLLLIPLVENAFKHGASETRRNPFVDIHLSIKSQQLSFTVKNSVESRGEEEILEENIGLSNLRRQLELLYTEYDLNLEKQPSTFTAILNINLASNVQY